ncbi:NUDIX hydrolase [Chryseobacterium sp. MFBS3-17]|uniref:NUDIX hydrolase n=1 Tax=Chryseobacterium sp. MFBS3-17 TaxID=2886689 RepID=UPI001D0DE335|nr:NUDIX domain-containing protein [Chryseobacterium sp. MFBS3-17]MCC2589848.1 NUDIX domain-containing protein [Chryseobacterium sp. MFBS3-17]
MKYNDIKNHQSFEELLQTRHFVPHISVDCLIFGFHNHKLKVLLVKYPELKLWSVPGGFVFEDENLDDAAHRTLYERTALVDLFLEQFHTFGRINRTDLNNPHRILLQNRNISVDEDHWIHQRFITVGYYALIDYSLAHTFPDSLNESCEWFDVDALPDMAFDHAEIVESALSYLRKNLDYKIVGSNLLPEKFTMKELQTLYEAILNEKFLRNNFQRKILSLNMLQRLEKYYDGSANKAPYLYRFLEK